MDSIRYYDEYAEEFYARTVSADMSALHEPFLALLPSGGHILDAGCGSGRDSRVFQGRGFQVTAFDGSEAMVALSSKLLNQPVLRLRFQDLAFEDKFDGIWACASLLHVPRSQIDSVMGRLSRALRHDGVLFVSFKYGDQEGDYGERFFNCYDEASFAPLVARYPELQIIKMWQTQGVQSDEYWFDALMRCVRAPTALAR